MVKAQLQKFYNKKMNGYEIESPNFLEKIYSKFKKYELHRIDAATKLLSQGTSILDIGTGNGDLLIKAGKNGFTNLYGIEVSFEMVQSCKKYLKSKQVSANISCQNIDEGTNFKNEQFDTVTCIAVLEHVFNPSGVLEEVRRILKKNGQLIIEVPNITFFSRRFSFLLGRLPKTSDEGNYKDGHLQIFTFNSLKNLLAKHGFNVIYTGCSGIGYKYRTFYPALLGANIFIKAIKK